MLIFPSNRQNSTSAVCFLVFVCGKKWVSVCRECYFSEGLFKNSIKGNEMEGKLAFSICRSINSCLISPF